MEIEPLFKRNFDNFNYLNRNSKQKIRYLLNKKMQKKIISKLKDLKDLVQVGAKQTEEINDKNAYRFIEKVRLIEQDIKEAEHIGKVLTVKPFTKKLDMR